MGQKLCSKSRENSKPGKILTVYIFFFQKKVPKIVGQKEARKRSNLYAVAQMEKGEIRWKDETLKLVATMIGTPCILIVFVSIFQVCMWWGWPSSAWAYGRMSGREKMKDQEILSSSRIYLKNLPPPLRPLLFLMGRGLGLNFQSFLSFLP